MGGYMRVVRKRDGRVYVLPPSEELPPDDVDMDYGTIPDYEVFDSNGNCKVLCYNFGAGLVPFADPSLHSLAAYISSAVNRGVPLRLILRNPIALINGGIVEFISSALRSGYDADLIEEFLKDRDFVDRILKIVSKRGENTRAVSIEVYNAFREYIDSRESSGGAP